MRTLQIAQWTALAAVLGALAGCRAHTGQVLVEQESRMFEDEVYRLEGQLEACCRERDGLMAENADLKKQLTDGSSSAPAGSYRAPAVDVPSRRPRKETPKLEAPVIELPESSGEELPGATGEPPAGSSPSGAQPGPLGNQPRKLSINKRMTGGLDRDGKGGDEGIMLLVEPRDEQGRLVKSPGAVSVVVMDPAQSGEEARVARWDYQAHEAAEHFHATSFGEGLQFELPWPADAPKNRDLRLFVRCVTNDGTKLNADLPLRVRMPSDSPDGDGETTAEAASPRPTAPASRLKPRTTSRPGRQARGSRPEWRPYR